MNSDLIKVYLPNNKILNVEKGTKIHNIARSISSSLYKSSSLVLINNELKSMNFTLQKDSKVEFLTFENEDAKYSLRYTLSFLAGYAISKLFPDIKIADIGVDGVNFYCDFYSEKSIKKSDLIKIQKEINKVIKSNKPIQISSPEDIHNIFSFNPYMIYKIENASSTVAKLDDYSLIINSPLITNLSKLKNYELKNISATNWLRDINNDSLQRVSGIAFVESDELEEYNQFLENYNSVNHRKIGKELDLFMFSDYSPGMPFYTHNGQIVRLELQNLLRKLQFNEDYEEVYTPFIMDETLWKNSGHWDHYKDNMYFTKVDDTQYSLKPMNCPGHMIIYKNNFHSYRDLPIRMAEFGQVHRHELSGSLNGLFRVRTFNQDDAHIYVRQNQIENEILNVLNLIDTVYTIFGFDYSIELSTRPDDYMGDVDLWNFAENSLQNVLDSNNLKYSINEKDGAFYGPKIDIHIKDALGRSHQCGTIQLDFQMPEKFDLTYINESNEKERPVIIHRAIYGSIDRFIGILLEHFGGNMPLWLSPIQVNLIAVNNDIHLDYVYQLKKQLKSKGIRVNIDHSNEKMGYKIRSAQIKKIPYTLVIGDNEVQKNTVSVRKYGENHEVKFKINDFLEELTSQLNILNI
ncbi:threonine--tRNA ligase [Staphylococcus epidermidis]|uniref:threonine--tRNA ligase n=1 Tax=Staphylococcus epidermidis TaxID=1282 RepID=UPI001932BDD8|nr:threonine--tRNA ligase [Staphylococcus epidermidis]MBM0838689.1 threonine--tRNA ligase [Staphylococcus epidermidis]